MSVRPESALPLHAQITQEIRYRIATGRLRPGARLPAARDAAAQWRVNFHTVRRAYQELENLGLVERRGPKGTFVAPGLKRGLRERGLDTFLREAMASAFRRFGLTTEELALLLINQHQTRLSGRVTVVECNRVQAEELAADLQARYVVDVQARVLSSLERLPPGILVGTLFHYQEVIERWPDRRGSMRFLHIVPAADLAAEVRRAHGGSYPATLALFERDAGIGRAIAADIESRFDGEPVRVRGRLLQRDGAIPVAELRRVVLVAPRVWEGLPAAQRAMPNVLRVRYQFESSDLDALAAALRWPVREARERGPHRECPLSMRVDMK